jgi:alcohol dehydrogenase
MFTASNPLYTGLIARALGAGRVTLVDARPVVRRHAERLGLDAVDPCDLDRAATAPLVVDVSVCPAGLRLALALTAPDGLCSSAGLLHNSMRFPALSSYIRNVTLRIGRAHARSAIPLVLELMVDGRLHPEAVTTLVAPIDDAIGAYREHCGPEGVKTILVA